jgi:Domain of unknown function (DUF4286)
VDELSLFYIFNFAFLLLMEGSIIYNITVKPEQEIAKEFVLWLQEEHLPEILGTGCFTGYKLIRLLEVDDAEGPTYAIQLYADSLDPFYRYRQEFEPLFIKKSFVQWGEQFVSFRTLMEIVK